MKCRFLALFAPLAIMLSAATAAAAPQPFRIDPGHTLVGFNIRHFFSRVSGRFKDFNGMIQFDDKDLAASSVEVTIQTASINTENERRDGDLRSANFFQADSFPTITFKSTKVTAGPDKSFLIYGDLNMHGVTKPITLQATLLGVGEVGMDGRPARTIAGFEAKGALNRKDFGIVWNRTLDQGGTMLGDDVALTFSVEAGKFDPNATRPPGVGQPPAPPDKK